MEVPESPQMAALTFVDTVEAFTSIKLSNQWDHVRAHKLSPPSRPRGFFNQGNSMNKVNSKTRLSLPRSKDSLLVNGSRGGETRCMPRSNPSTPCRSKSRVKVIFMKPPSRLSWTMNGNAARPQVRFWTRLILCDVRNVL